MAQTRKRRSRKHRGTQGGGIQRRPKGRPRNRAEARQRARSKGRGGATTSRADRRPSWGGAFARGGLAAGVFFLLMLLGFGRSPAESAGLALFMLAIYVPFGYYFDLFLYRRRQRKQQEERQAKAEK